MPRPMALLKRSLIFVHRWLGVVLSLVFMLWFVSGIVMMYWGFPEIAPRDRLERAPLLDPSRIKLTAQQAAAVLTSAPAQIRLTSYDGRPVFRFGGGGRRRGGGQMVFADDGTQPADVDDATIDRTAAAWSGHPVSDARKELTEQVDQWTISSARTLPLHKYTWPDGQQVYVSDGAEVVQYTTTASRFWAYLGAIPHWLYFTPLRKNGRQWFSVVVWSSMIGTVATLLGLVIAIWMYSPGKRYRYAGAPTSIPYRGWKRWHAIVGLFFGVITVTWVFSGLLSMGPFPILERLTALTVPVEGDDTGSGGPGARDVDIEGALRGTNRPSLASFSDRPPDKALASVADFGARELELTFFAGQPVYLASNSHGETRIVPVHGTPAPSFDTNDVMRLIRAEAGDQLAELRVMDEYDAYYLDRRGERPLPVVYVRLNDAVGTRFYVDPKTARIVGEYSAREWISRWLYHGLHSLDLPFLYKHRPLWDIVVIGLMLGGTAVCVTSLVLAWKVLARKVLAIAGRRLAASDDLLAEAEP